MRAVTALFAFALVAAAQMPRPAVAQEEVVPERCPKLVAWNGLDRRAAATLVPAQTEGGEVGLTFVGHASFLIDSPAGVRIVTDYNDRLRPDVTPEIATMNRAHVTHYSTNPDPGIDHLLRGWGEDGEPARHELEVGDVWLRNVTTNIRGGMGETVRDQNSIFVFEVAGLCIAHLGHLHHTLTDAHLDALGRIDVVLAPVDGSYTLDTDGMIAVVKALQAPLVVPMHFFGQATLERFIARIGEDYEIVRNESGATTLSRDALPARPTVMVLPGRHF